MAQLSAAKVMLSILANRPDPTAQAYDVLTHLYYRQLPKLQYWNFGRWNDSAYLHFAEIAACWEAPLLLKNICPESGQIRDSKYDWSLANPSTVLITSDACGWVKEWYGSIISLQDVIAQSNKEWVRSNDLPNERKPLIWYTPSIDIEPYQGNWLASAELRPSLQSFDCDSPFVTPESIVNDIKAGRP